MQWQLWSRHLQWVSTQAQTVSDPQGVGVLIGQYALVSGYSAVGLTVRNGGHVQPENVATHLPLMLKGIRSTGCICNHIGTDISPAVDAEDVSWISTQRVHEVLSVASANGIERYRTMTRNLTANSFGAEMQAQLDSLRINHQRLAQINAKYRLNALYHTHSANTLGISVCRSSPQMPAASTRSTTAPVASPALPSWPLTWPKAVRAWVNWRRRAGSRPNAWPKPLPASPGCMRRAAAAWRGCRRSSSAWGRCLATCRGSIRGPRSRR